MKINKILLILIISFFCTQNLYAYDNLPNDPELEKLFYLQNIKALNAWEINAKSPDVVVAVIDTGVDIYNPDLEGNIWINTDEVMADGIDNDDNGYIDDYYGWDFIISSPDPRPKFHTKKNKIGIIHGTIVAGVIGARGNNDFGVTGLTWETKIMSLRALNAVGSGDMEFTIEAIYYAVDNGADIINLSIIGDAFHDELEKAIKYAYDNNVVLVTAAGNNVEGEAEMDLDILPRYPVCIDSNRNYVLGVGSVNPDDEKSYYSNYGSDCLDLVAPGENIYSLRVYEPIFGDYQEYFGGFYSGTSMAAPLVSATAALIKGLRPELLNYEIYDLIINNTDDIDNLNLKYKTKLGSGRLNTYESLLAAASYESEVMTTYLAPKSGFKPEVRIFNNEGQVIKSFLAYNENFIGGVNLASADLDDNGIKEIITGAGTSGGPHVRIFNQNGEVLKQFFAYDINFDGGVLVDAGDVDNDGEIEIITAPQKNAKPLIKIFNSDLELESEFLAFDESYRGELNLTLSDINGDGSSEIVVNSGQEVKIFTNSGKLIHKFNISVNNLSNDVRVIASNLYGDIRSEFIVIAGTTDKAFVNIFSTTGNLEYSWQAFNEFDLHDLDIAVGNFNKGPNKEVLVINKNLLRVYSFNGELLDELVVDYNNQGVNIVY